MATHYIPKNLKGETRILMIFSTHSLITTAVGLGVGGILFFICSLLKIRAVGIILLLLFALIGFAAGTFKIPKITGLNFTKNIEGDSIDEIVIRYVKFKANKKIYTYTKEEE
ncbi:MAG: hypothetical protein Q4E61_03655 [Alphaproteobacteria bacterium]|nr:hypothetical protein [Alphaproteobacteria bacterium]